MISSTRMPDARGGTAGRSARRALLACLVLVAAACDPCLGTRACVEPHVYATGELFWHLSGEPARGVEVTFTPDAGSTLVTSPVRALSGERGIFRIDVRTGRVGEVTGTLSFRPPDPYYYQGFDLHGVRLVTTEVRGNPQFLGTWGVGPLPGAPHLSYVGELRYDDTGALAAGVEVEFRRTGGIAVEPDTLVLTTNEMGRFPLFMTPVGAGEVVGDLLVRPPAPYRPLEIRNVRMPTLVGVDEIRLLGVWRITR